MLVTSLAKEYDMAKQEKVSKHIDMVPLDQMDRLDRMNTVWLHRMGIVSKNGVMRPISQNHHAFYSLTLFYTTTILQPSGHKRNDAFMFLS